MTETKTITFERVTVPDSSFVDAVYQLNEDTLAWFVNEYEDGYVYKYQSPSKAASIFDEIEAGGSAGIGFRSAFAERVRLEDVNINSLAAASAPTVSEVNVPKTTVDRLMETFTEVLGEWLSGSEEEESDTPIKAEEEDFVVVGEATPVNVVVAREYDEDGELIAAYEVSRDAKFVLTYGSEGLNYTSL